MSSAYWSQWRDDIESMHGMDFPYEEDELDLSDCLDDEEEEDDDWDEDDYD